MNQQIYKRVRWLKKIGTLKILESVSQLTMQDVRVIISQRSFRKWSFTMDIFIFQEYKLNGQNKVEI